MWISSVLHQPSCQVRFVAEYSIGAACRPAVGAGAHCPLADADLHLLEEVHALCNRAMIISDGRLLVDDSPIGLITRSRYHDAMTLVVEQPERAASVLSELPQAGKVELREGELTVFPAEGCKLFEVITDAIREHGWSVSELRLEAGRLDEVFRQITKGETT